MEEDIKILENYIYGNKETMKELLVPAIKNLLKRYKELEEENKRKNIEPVIINNKMYFIDKELYIDLLKDIKTDYIPTSVIENKKKKLEYQTLYINGITDKTETQIASLGALMGKIQVLQELLEERNK